MEDKIIISGKRKRAVARAIIFNGNGEIRINRKNYKNLNLFEKLKIEEPLRIAKETLGELKFNILVNVRGGGEKSQIEAARLAIARAIVKFTNSQELKEKYLAYDWNLLIADIRRKEPYKPGDSKARSRRQTSYR